MYAARFRPVGSVLRSAAASCLRISGGAVRKAMTWVRCSALSMPACSAISPSFESAVETRSRPRVCSTFSTGAVSSPPLWQAAQKLV